MPFPVFDVEKTESDHYPLGTLPNTKKWLCKPNVEHCVQVTGQCYTECVYAGVCDVLHESGDATCIHMSTEQGNTGPCESPSCIWWPLQCPSSWGATTSWWLITK